MEWWTAGRESMAEAPVESVRRAFHLLHELNRQRVSSVRHLHRATGLPKPTIVRLLDTLIALGYVVNDRRQGGYQVTSLVRSLSAGFHGDPLVVEAARPWAIAFTRKYHWPVAVAVLDRDAVAIRFSTIPDSPVSPFHATINMRLQVPRLGPGLHRVLSTQRAQPAAADARRVR
jgi:IclR family transcriptional regulator, mhp operon transcriptional activator